ncbi:hypothetical protein BV25DRAFT_1096254 [Artomyces pyxidatus]|uniref:Uncharacterized protein n=1 Tax=Artomyces pyxidatus TaxID=48021 RepID=A0ACB8TG52_9AGAM|nr:hypothetical protein BV25DRAFT_1096254 [Artomyces pyxidatus]
MRPSPHPVHSLEGGGGSWDQGMLMEPEQPQPAPHASPPSAGYPLSSITTHGKASYTSYPSPIPPSRPNLPGTMFLGSTSPSAQNFSNATERPMADAYGGTSAGYPLRDIRDDPPPQQPPQQQPQHFSYSQSPFSTPDPGHIHHSAQSSSMQMHPQRDAPPSQSSMQYPQPHRRSITEPQAQYRSSQYPLPTSQTSSTMRRPSSPRLPEGSHLRPQYGGGGG